MLVVERRRWMKMQKIFDPLRLELFTDVWAKCLGAEVGGPMGSPIFPSGCEGKLGVALESLQGLRDLT